MTTKKFFMAKPKDGSEPVYFDLEDIWYYRPEKTVMLDLETPVNKEEVNITRIPIEFNLQDWLKDYDLYHLENGEYVEHKGGGE